MKSATFRIQNPLLKELYKIKPQSKSLASYVREALTGLVKKHQMLNAAQEYKNFLSNNDDETAWLADWETADLASTPLRKKFK